MISQHLLMLTAILCVIILWLRSDSSNSLKKGVVFYCLVLASNEGSLLNTHTVREVTYYSAHNIQILMFSTTCTMLFVLLKLCERWERWGRMWFDINVNVAFGAILTLFLLPCLPADYANQHIGNILCLVGLAVLVIYRWQVVGKWLGILLVVYLGIELVGHFLLLTEHLMQGIQDQRRDTLHMIQMFRFGLDNIFVLFICFLCMKKNQSLVVNWADSEPDVWNNGEHNAISPISPTESRE